MNPGHYFRIESTKKKDVSSNNLCLYEMGRNNKIDPFLHFKFFRFFGHEVTYIIYWSFNFSQKGTIKFSDKKCHSHFMTKGKRKRKIDGGWDYDSFIFLYFYHCGRGDREDRELFNNLIKKYSYIFSEEFYKNYTAETIWRCVLLPGVLYDLSYPPSVQYSITLVNLPSVLYDLHYPTRCTLWSQLSSKCPVLP